MSDRFDEFPDSEAMMAEIIRDALSGDSIGVYSSIPHNPTYPIVVIRRIGGVPPLREHLDRADLQIDVFGSNKGEAYDLAARVRTIAMDSEGQHERGFITFVDDTLGMLFLPDIEVTPSVDRYIFGVAVYCHS